ncbi:M48 family metalloprotease [Agrobacterium sp. T29]|uniref:M48 family metalloprotease n=1 Tax=Agrobacterium sp. T29 TaxID=2580515 RepID=UPI00115D8C89|nr:M48 family metalloprotease [Agrobacterium sp. T29]
MRISTGARSATIELSLHLFVLAAVLLPVLAIVFPALLLLVGATILSSAYPEGPTALWLKEGTYGPISVACFSALMVGVAGAVWSARHSGSDALRLRDLGGKDAAKLTDQIGAIWKDFKKSGTVPAARWFPAMDIAAYAHNRAGNAEIHVSAGLWRSVVSDEPIARAILAHELAHVAYRDPTTLRILAYVVAAIQSVIFATAGFSALTTGYLLFHETQRMAGQSAAGTVIVAEWIRILLMTSSVLILLPIGWLALRRQVAFITSLIEIRADIAAAEWTVGLEAYTQLFASNSQVIPTSGRDFWRSLVSPTFSHIPQRERLAILRTPGLIATPKLRFFALSLLLVFLIPVNFATPLLYGGAANHFAMLVLSMTFNVAVVLMILVSAPQKTVSFAYDRLAILAFASCLISALPRINLEPVSYLAMSWFAGFGGEPADWNSLAGDGETTIIDLSEMVSAALPAVYSTAAMFLSFFSLLCLATSGRSRHLLAIRCAACAVATIIGSFIAGLDPFRQYSSFEGGTITELMTETESLRGLSLALPMGIAVVTEGLIMLIGRLLPARQLVSVSD